MAIGTTNGKPSKDKSKLDKLRSELRSLKKERDNIVFRKGILAQDNQDLWENSAYDILTQQEWLLTNKILKLIKEIEDLYKDEKNRTPIETII